MMALLPLMSASLAILGYVRTQRVVERISGLRAARPSTPTDVAAGEQWARLLDIAGRRNVVKATCLPQSLVLYGLLRAQGLRPILRIGVRRQTTEPDMHAWVEVDGIALGQTKLEHTAFNAPTAKEHAIHRPHKTQGHA